MLLWRGLGGLEKNKYTYIYLHWYAGSVSA